MQDIWILLDIWMATFGYCFKISILLVYCSSHQPHKIASASLLGSQTRTHDCSNVSARVHLNLSSTW